MGWKLNQVLLNSCMHDGTIFMVWDYKDNRGIGCSLVGEVIVGVVRGGVKMDSESWREWEGVGCTV